MSRVKLVYALVGLVPLFACTSEGQPIGDEAESESDASTTNTGTTDTAESDASTTNTGTTETGEELQPVCDFDLPAAIRASDLSAHLEALDAIAIDHDGTRVAGSPGYDASAEYVEARLAEAGYTTTRWMFEFERYEHATAPVFERLDVAQGFVEGEDYNVALWSPSGMVSGALVPVDLSLGLGNASTSGCEAEDFSGFPAGSIALIQRGGCAFVEKAAFAEQAGAIAVVVFNQGHEDTTSAQGLFNGSLGSTNSLSAPVVFVPYALGEALADAAELGAVELTIAVDAGAVAYETFNVFAERPGVGEAAERVVMLGAHLDSVPAGPGVNDNGSGSATVLTLAERFSACQPRHTVRFAWWGAEEWGLIGSQKWVYALDPSERDEIALYLNFDMVASPNYVRYVHDGETGPAGSTLLYDAFAEWFAGQELAITPTGFAGRSDYQPFVDAGIPAGGLATGANGSKSPSEAETYGGQVGEPYDLCYHQACDTKANFDAEVIEQNARAAADSLVRWSGDVGPVDAARAPGSDQVIGADVVEDVEALEHDAHACGYPHE